MPRGDGLTVPTRARTDFSGKALPENGKYSLFWLIIICSYSIKSLFVNLIHKPLSFILVVSGKYVPVPEEAFHANITPRGSHIINK